MPHRIEVAFKEDVTDALGNKIEKRVIENLGISVDSIRTVDIYTIDKELSEEKLAFLGQELFIDPIIQDFTYDKPITDDFNWTKSIGFKVIEVGLKPGVTDIVGKTSMKAIEDILKEKFGPQENIYTSRQYIIKGDVSRDDLERIAKDVLANDQTQRWLITYDTFKESARYLEIPNVRIPHEPRIELIDLNASDEILMKISKERKVALNLEEMKVIKNYLSRSDVIAERKKVGLDSRITDGEIEADGQSWSEHCQHKIFNAKIKYKEGSIEEEIDSLFDTYIKSSTRQLQEELDWIVSTLWDNSGVMRFNDKWLIAIKCETHNSPSNEEPYGGAITGIVGVYRDPMGTGRGCRLIFGTYGFCTGNPFYDGRLRPKIHPKRLLEGVRKGVEDGGNKHGVPTPYGVTFFDDGFMGKPGIYVEAVGLIPAKVNGKPGYEKRADPGDLIVMCGGRVGIDGIHGATESSMEAGEWISAGHVQIGDPFTQKKMHDFLIEARDLGLYNCITDNGAGGLSSSVGEMGQFTNGFELYLDKVPLKYSGLDPWQILLSESQERMTLSVNPDEIDRLLDLAKRHDVELSVIGKFTDSGKFHTIYEGRTVTYLDMDLVHNGVPQMKLDAKWVTPEERGLFEPTLRDITDHETVLKYILASLNVCSKEYIVRQFDHEVQGTSVIKHLVGKDSDVFNDAVVIKPVLDSKEGIAIAAGINPKYSEIDTYHMTACVLDEAIKRIISVGGSLKQIALNDNFCWPSPLPGDNNPEAKYKLAQLVRANKALYEYTLAFKTPCISGKDSMSMDGTIKDADGEEHRISALPTLQFSATGKVDDVNKCVTMDVKKPGDLVYILGITNDELGGSEYYETMGVVGLNVPKIDAKSAVKLYNSLTEAIKNGLVESAHGCYRGGLGISLTQTSFAGGYGIEVDLKKVPTNDLDKNYKVLYSESGSRFVVTVSADKREKFEKIMQGNVYGLVGYVRDDEKFKVKGINGEEIIEENIYDLKKAWKETFEEF